MLSRPEAAPGARELDARLQTALDRVEHELARAATGATVPVTEAARHIIQAGGKRFRPRLTLLAAEFGPRPDVDRAVTAALVVELTHVATLYHDDVMDEAELRRGAESANARWGNAMAILVGDLLFSRASSEVATLGTEYVTMQAETFARLVHGQIAETVGPADGTSALDHHLRVVADKTGSLIATSAAFGAMTSGADEATVDLLTRFGEEIGVVFQLSDDLLDIVSDVSGKTAGTDLREGIPTLPTLLLGDEPADRRLREAIEGDLSDDARLAEVVAELRAHPVIGRVRDEVRARADRARALLAGLAPGPARDELDELCVRVVERTA